MFGLPKAAWRGKDGKREALIEENARMRQDWLDQIEEWKFRCWQAYRPDPQPTVTPTDVKVAPDEG